ncbi:MAG: M20/M25/M40 family metallo-hydrolase [Candidatus Methanomethyliaceae archaeon]|nr:M20/M25/M40 family metallo-hydrolase [Candidatus Methanomethyliaceae archaeon]
MEEGYPERLLLDLLEIYSPSGEEEEISRYLSKELERLGFKVRVDEVGNVEAIWGDGRPNILLCGHMDTVRGKIKVKKRGKVVFGRGAVDAKSPLAALICGAKKYIEGGGKGKITLLAVVDEEGKSKGMRHFLSRCKEKYDYAIFGEPSGAYALTVGYKGRILIRVLCETSPGHASAPTLFENAIYVTIRLIERLQKLGDDWTKGKEGDLFETPTLCVTRIKGGREDNTVPSFCEILVDVRVPPTMTLAEVKDRLTSTINEFKTIEERAKVKLEFLDENEPYLENEHSPLVKCFIESIKEVTGRDGRLSRKTGTADVNDFVKKFKTSSVVYGPGNSKLDHTPIENVSIEEYLDSIEIINNVLKKLSSTD